MTTGVLNLICNVNTSWWAGNKLIYTSKRKFLHEVFAMAEGYMPDFVPFYIKAGPLAHDTWQRPCYEQRCEGDFPEEHWHQSTGRKQTDDVLCYAITLDNPKLAEFF